MQAKSTAKGLSVAKIAFLDTTKLAFDFNFHGMATLLAGAGHDLMLLHGVPDGGKPPIPGVQYVCCSWMGMALTEFERFNPDYVVVFNGYHPHRYAATRYIEQRWRTYYVENGWLPQEGSLYLDTEGLGKSIQKTQYHPQRTSEYLALRDSAIANLQSNYATSPSKANGLPKDYILVPLQLEQDTSIIFNSPYFKTMLTFVHYVNRHFCDRPIVIKTHPKSLVDFDFPGVRIIREKTSMNALVQGASLVVGINSTSLIEALVHYKPVAALGYNVASGRGAFIGEPKEMMFGNPRDVLDRAVDRGCIDDALYFLTQQQFSRERPCGSILKHFV